MYHGGELAHHYPKVVEALGPWTWTNEVYGDGSPKTRWIRQTVEQLGRFLNTILPGLANTTQVAPLLHVASKERPPVPSPDVISSLPMSKVA